MAFRKRDTEIFLRYEFSDYKKCEHAIKLGEIKGIYTSNKYLFLTNFL